MEQPRHPLVLTFSRLALEGEVPEFVANVWPVIKLAQTIHNVVMDQFDFGIIKWLGLPLLDFFYHFGRLLSFSEVDEISDVVWRAVLNES